MGATGPGFNYLFTFLPFWYSKQSRQREVRVSLTSPKRGVTYFGVNLPT